VIRSDELLKVHIHTDEPQQVFAYLRTLGKLATHKAEDMQAQHAAVGRAAAGGHLSLARRPVSVVVDSACDLPDEVLRAHGMQLVPLNLIFESEVLRDRFDISAEEFVGRLRQGAHPTTSQPAPGAFLEAFRRAGEEGEAVVAVLLSGAVSGTFASAQAAGRQLPADDGAAPLHLFDSRGLSLLQGLLALKASELGEMGRSADEVMAELERIRAKSGFFVVLDSFERALASGRIGRGRAWLGILLDIKPVLEFDRTGKLALIAKVRGRPAVLPKMLELLEKKVPPGAKKVRFGVTHVAFPEILDAVVPEIRARYGADGEILTATATPVLATHAGEGAWGLAYLVED
jgi:DegV family protein with EDD domain